MDIRDINAFYNKLIHIHAITGDFHGYKIENFIDRPEDLKIITCQICRGVYNRPLMLPCNHWACEKCANQFKYCPTDRKKFTMDQCYYSKKMEIHINSKPVHCVNKTKGCIWEGSLRELKPHLIDSCKYLSISCRNNCGISFPPIQVLYHENFQCPLRIAVCKICNANMVACNLYFHEMSGCNNKGHLSLKAHSNFNNNSLRKSKYSRSVNPSRNHSITLPRRLHQFQPEVKYNSQINPTSLCRTMSVPKAITLQNDRKGIDHTYSLAIDIVKEIKESTYQSNIEVTRCRVPDSPTSSTCSHFTTEDSISPILESNDNAEPRSKDDSETEQCKLSSDDSGFFSSSQGELPNTILNEIPMQESTLAKPREPLPKQKKRLRLVRSFKLFSMKSKSKNLARQSPVLLKHVGLPTKDSLNPQLIQEEYNKVAKLNGKIEWEIKNAKELLKKKQTTIIYSESFYTNDKGYKACIRGHFGNKKASFYLCLQKGENDKKLKWPFKGQCSIGIENSENLFSKVDVSGSIPGAKVPKKSENLCSLCYIICDDVDLNRENLLESNSLVIMGQIRTQISFIYTEQNVQRAESIMKQTAKTIIV